MYCIFYYLNWHFSKIVYKYFLYFNKLCAIPVFEDNVPFIISITFLIFSIINKKIKLIQKLFYNYITVQAF